MTDLALGLLLSPVMTAIFLYVFKTWISNQLKKEAEKEIDAHRHELDVKKEIIKDEITKTGLKALFLANSKQALYPELYEALKKTAGAVTGLSGFRYAPTYEAWSLDEFKILLSDTKLPTEIIDDILKSLSNDKINGLKKLSAALRRIEFQQTRQQCQEVKNKIVLKSLFLSKEVNDLAFEIIKGAIGLAIDTEYMNETRKPLDEINTIKTTIERQMSELETLMKAELFGDQNK